MIKEKLTLLCLLTTSIFSSTSDGHFLSFNCPFHRLQALWAGGGRRDNAGAQVQVEHLQRMIVSQQPNQNASIGQQTPSLDRTAVSSAVSLTVAFQKSLQPWRSSTKLGEEES